MTCPNKIILMPHLKEVLRVCVSCHNSEYVIEGPARFIVVATGLTHIKKLVFSWVTVRLRAHPLLKIKKIFLNSFRLMPRTISLVIRLFPV